MKVFRLLCNDSLVQYDYYDAGPACGDGWQGVRMDTIPFWLYGARLAWGHMLGQAYMLYWNYGYVSQQALASS